MKRASHGLFRLAVLGMFFLECGCSVLLGNVRPHDEKSKSYTVLDLARANPAEWTRLEDSALADTAFQARKGGGVLAVLSSCRSTKCRPGAERSIAELRKQSGPLLRGMTDVTLKREQLREVNGVPALETTTVGMMNLGPGRAAGPVVVQSVVLHWNDCGYELLGVSAPEAFEALSAKFSEFVDSFHLVTEGGPKAGNRTL